MEAIHHAATLGHLPAVERALDEQPPSLDARVEADIVLDDEPILRCTPLMLAAWCSSEEIVDLLLDRGAALDLQDADGATAVHWACKQNAAAILARLLDAGACPFTKDAQQATPLHVAVQWDAEACAHLLLDRVQQDVDAPDDDGDTPLICAAAHYRPSLVTRLLEAGADPFRQNNHGFTALEVAVFSDPDYDEDQPEEGQDKAACISILETAIHEPERAWHLRRWRAINEDVGLIVDAGVEALMEKLPPDQYYTNMAAAAPAYLRGRILEDKRRALPHLEKVDPEAGLVAEVFQEAVNMVPDVFAELMEYLK